MTLDYGNNGIFLILGNSGIVLNLGIMVYNAGFISSTVASSVQVEQLSARVGSSFPGCPEDCEETERSRRSS